MAQSRLERIGTIFSRVSGLLRSEAMKPQDKPIWYDVYKAFPPKYEPRFDRPPTEDKIKNIFYAEDVVRAKYHKVATLDTANLSDFKNDTQSQCFIKIYKDLKSQNPIYEEKVFETALDLLEEQKRLKNVKYSSETKDNLLTNNAEQQNKEDNQPVPTVNIKNLFNE